jgi:hypothetical protein
MIFMNKLYLIEYDEKQGAYVAVNDKGEIGVRNVFLHSLSPVGPPSSVSLPKKIKKGDLVARVQQEHDGNETYSQANCFMILSPNPLPGLESTNVQFYYGR